jgi:hypothetical protein
VFNFELTADEVNSIDEMNSNSRIFTYPQYVAHVHSLLLTSVVALLHKVAALRDCLVTDADRREK